ncbi:hypothetical protein [Parachlamydia sp. AcF125]|uniref:hypothetical protein n=1 Tax=Parachlamydia sp. AcF125 TaxID=2795736 RepID=UPI001BC8E94D|nr:hypothetical protein [Parachlamydia sp. AcF125]MBS4169143.1 hypothetical protein [Parachlamydia sp. AcF125]
MENRQIKIYPSATPFSEIPSGYQAVLISLDGTVKGNLDWKKEKEWASQCIEEGLTIFWEMRLGLFSALLKPISHRTQFLSLGLSLEHFLQGPWLEFHEHSLGLCIYKGNADLSENFSWEPEHVAHFQNWLQDLFGEVEKFQQESGLSVESFKEVNPSQAALKSLGALFCRDLAADYVDLLAGHMSQVLPLFLLMDATSIQDPALQMQLLLKERFPRFEMGVKGSLIGNPAMRWENNALYYPATQNQEKMAICLPSLKREQSVHFRYFSKVIEVLNIQAIPFRVISEQNMTHEWDELDTLFVLPDCLSSEGKRKLMGFCAAGGQVVSLGYPLGVPEELSFKEWQEKIL